MENFGRRVGMIIMYQVNSIRDQTLSPIWNIAFEFGSGKLTGPQKGHYGKLT